MVRSRSRPKPITIEPVRERLAGDTVVDAVEVVRIAAVLVERCLRVFLVAETGAVPVDRMCGTGQAEQRGYSGEERERSHHGGRSCGAERGHAA